MGLRELLTSAKGLISRCFIRIAIWGLKSSFQLIDDLFYWPIACTLLPEICLLKLIVVL